MDYCTNTTLKKKKGPLLLRLLTTNYSYSIKRVVVTVVVVVTPPQGRGGKGGGLEGVWGGGGRGVWLSTWQELRESDDAALCTQRLTSARCWPDETAKRFCEAAGLMSEWTSRAGLHAHT